MDISSHFINDAPGKDKHFRKNKLGSYLEKNTPPYIFKIFCVNTSFQFKKYHNYVNFQLNDMKFGM